MPAGPGDTTVTPNEEWVEIDPDWIDLGDLVGEVILSLLGDMDAGGYL